jgi:hypothetical protein
MSSLFLPSIRRVLPSLLRAVIQPRKRYLLGVHLSTAAAGGKSSKEFNESPFAICRFDWKDPLQMRHQFTEEEASSYVTSTSNRKCGTNGVTSSLWNSIHPLSSYYTNCLFFIDCRG